MQEKMKERSEVLNKLFMEKGYNYRVILQSSWKNNMEVLGYSIVSDTSRACPVIRYSEEWYSKSDEELIKYFDELYRSNSFNSNLLPDIDYELVKNNVMPKIVSSQNIPLMNENKVSHIELQNTDLVICFYIQIKEINECDANASIQINDNILDSIGMNIQEAYLYAMDNLEKVITIKPMLEIISSLVGDEWFEDEDFDENNSSHSMYVISNKTEFNGAASILSNRAMNKAKEILGSKKLIILPSSIHECILLPYKDEDLLELKKMVIDINATNVPNEDVLTDNVYIYNNNEIISIP